MFRDPPVSKYAVCAGKEIHYLEWGQSDLPTVLAWHGLARVGQDFDAMAQELKYRYRVIAPDTLGRGLSQWAEDGDTEYCFEFYGRVVLELCDQLGIGNFAWIGTSMGGSLGMYLSGDACKDRISHLVINDIGPELPQSAIDRILTYVGSPPELDSMTELERYLRAIYAPFGYIPGDEWRKIIEASYRRLENGKITTHYDPKIVNQFIIHPGDWRLWEKYDAIKAKTLLLRGEYSDLLSKEMAEEMRIRGPGAAVLECIGCGHAPALNVPVQIEAIDSFLSE